MKRPLENQFFMLKGYRFQISLNKNKLFTLSNMLFILDNNSAVTIAVAGNKPSATCVEIVDATV